VARRGPAGTGAFFVEISGSALAEILWVRVPVLAGDTAVAVVSLPPGVQYAVRAYAIDARTDPQLSEVALVQGIGRVVDVSVASAQLTPVAITASSVSVVALTAPDTVPTFTGATVRWDVIDSTAATLGFDGGVRYDTTAWAADSIVLRVNALWSQVGPSRYRWQAQLPAWSVPGTRWWQALLRRTATGAFGSNELFLAAPSLSRGESLRQLNVTEVAEGVDLTLRGPPGTGTFFVEVGGGGLNETLWRRVPVLAADTAVVSFALPAASQYRVRVYAIDARTDPAERRDVLVHGIGRAVNVTVPAGQRLPLTVTATTVAIQALTAPDSIPAFASASVSWDVVDTTQTIIDFEVGVRHDTASWASDSVVLTTKGFWALAGPGRYRFTVGLPQQVEAQTLRWQALLSRSATGVFGSNELFLAAPSRTRGDSLRTLRVLPLSSGLRLSLRGPAGTGAFVLQVSGGPLTQTVWARVPVLGADTALAELGLPVGSGYQVRAYAVDARTDPLARVDVLVHGIGLAADLVVSAGPLTPVTVTAATVAIAALTAPDSVPTFAPTIVTWEVVDSTGVIVNFDGGLRFGADAWAVDSIAESVGAFFSLVGPRRYRWTAEIPGQVQAGGLRWQALLSRPTSGLPGSNRLFLAAPSLSRGEQLRLLEVHE
jgi:hypothetical protein